MHNCSIENLLILFYADRSIIKFAAQAFLSPNTYIDLRQTEEDIVTYEHIVNIQIPNDLFVVR